MRLSRLLLFLFIPLFGLAQRSKPTMNIRACDTLIMQGHYARAASCLQPHYNANPQGPSYEKLLDAYLLSSDSSAALKLVVIKANALEMGALNTQRLLGA